MNHFVMAMVATIALSGFTHLKAEAAGTPPALSTADQAAVRALVDGFADSWNRHDMKAMHDLDTEDVEWINAVGHVWRGKTTVYRGHDAFHKTLARKTVMSIESAVLRSLAPNVAVAVATMHFSPLVAPDGTDFGPPGKSRGSFIAVKRDGVWKIVHFHNTTIDPRYENDDMPNWPEATSPPEGKDSKK